MAKWWDKTKAAASRMWNAQGNPLTQKQHAEAYDPNRENFSAFGDQGYAQGQAGQLGYAQQGAHDTAAGYRSTGEQLQGQAQGYQYRTAPQIDRVGVSADQAGQNRVGSGVNQLYSWGNREDGPSAAQAQLNNATAANMRGNLALARSGRGAGSAQAMRSAIGQNTIAGGEAANNAAILRAQEINAQKARELSALQSGTGAANNLYQSDTSRDLTQAQIDAARATNQGQLTLDSRQANDAMTLGTGNQALGYAAAADAATGRAAQFEEQQQGWAAIDQGGRMGYEQLKGDQVLGASQTNAGIEAQRDQGTTGMAIGAMGALAAMSDERAKTDVSRTDALRAFSGFAGSGAPLIEMAADWRDRKDAEDSRALGTASGRSAYESSRVVSDEDEKVNKNSPENIPGVPKNQGLLGGLMGGAMSDVRSKSNVSPALATARSAPAYEYSYKDPERHGEGRYVGPMAQDLEKTPLGNTLVDEGPDGMKRLDTGRAGLVALSAVGEQQSELDRLYAEVEKLKKDPYSTSRWKALESTR